MKPTTKDNIWISLIFSILTVLVLLQVEVHATDLVYATPSVKPTKTKIKKDPSGRSGYQDTYRDERPAIGYDETDVRDISNPKNEDGRAWDVDAPALFGGSNTPDKLRKRQRPTKGDRDGMDEGSPSDERSPVGYDDTREREHDSDNARIWDVPGWNYRFGGMTNTPDKRPARRKGYPGPFQESPTRDESIPVGYDDTVRRDHPSDDARIWDVPSRDLLFGYCQDLLILQ